MESSRLGIGPAAPPTPAALRFVTTGQLPITPGFTFPELNGAARSSECAELLARVASEFAQKTDALATSSKPSLFNPHGKLPEGECGALVRDFSQGIAGLKAQELSETQQRDFSQLKKLARNFADFASTRPESIVQSHFSYMVDVLLDGCKAVLKAEIQGPPAVAESGEPPGSSITSNVRSARYSTSHLASTQDLERVYEHLKNVEIRLLDRNLPTVPGGSSESIGLTAHELAACFHAKQNAAATAISEKTLEYSERPTSAAHRELLETVRSADSALTKTAALTDNPFSYRYNDFRIVVQDFRSFLELADVSSKSSQQDVAAVIRKFSELVKAEARFGAWSFPGMELPERSVAGSPAQDIPKLDRSATWTRNFRPDRAFKKLGILYRPDRYEKTDKLEKHLATISERLTRAIEARTSIVPPAEPFVVGIFNHAESATLPKRFVDQTVVMQEEHRVPENLRGPNCGIMTVAPAEEISRWARDATVFSVQKGRELLGALYSFISQDKQPELTGQLIDIIRGSASSDLLKPGMPIVCSELVLTKKGANEEYGRVPENRYVLMNSLWQGSVCSQYYDHETVLCLGICRKDPPNTAITAHQRFGWKILPDVEFRFNEKASYYVMYQELHPRNSLVAQAQERSDKAAAEAKAPAFRPIEWREEDNFQGISPVDALRSLQKFMGLPRAPFLKARTVSLHANRLAVGVVGTLTGMVISGPTPQQFAHPKEYLMQHCKDVPVYGPERTQIELTKQNLSAEDRKELMKSCLIPVGSDSAVFVDKYYLLNTNPNAQAASLKELREAVQKQFPDRAVKGIVLDKLNTPETTLVTANIQFER